MHTLMHTVQWILTQYIDTHYTECVVHIDAHIDTLMHTVMQTVYNTMHTAPAVSRGNGQCSLPLSPDNVIIT